MDVRIVYIHHNCFVMRYGPRTILFDPPAPRHLPEKAAHVLERAIVGNDLHVFISHSHEDHFDPELEQRLKSASSIRSIASYDVEEMYPDALGNARFLEPDEVREEAGMRIETLESNDLGVAFLVFDMGITWYFGGDLANWNWPEQPDAAKAFTESFFEESLKRLEGKGIGVAFSNVDRRLKSLAGGPEFMARVRPQVFVPMHAFGRTRWVREFADEWKSPSGRVFSYAQPGDEKTYHIT